MITLRYGGETLHDPRSDARVTDCSCSLETNTAGELRLTVSPDHPLYDRLLMMSPTDEVVLLDGDDELFRGRIVSCDGDMQTTRAYVCSGQLSYLNDSIVPDYTAVSDPEHPELTRAPSELHGFVVWLIAQHNAQVEHAKRFAIGRNELPTSTVTFSSTQGGSIGAELKAKVLDKGSYVTARYTAGKRFLDFTVSGTGVSSQTIEFGSNLIDYASKIDSSSVVTCIEAVGTDGLDLSTMADGVDGRVEKAGRRVYDREGVKAYGTVAVRRSYDVTTVAGLYTAAVRDVLASSATVESLTIKAVDLSMVDPTLDPIRVGDYVHIRSTPHRVNMMMLCIAVKIDVGDPSGTEYTFGATVPSLTRASSSTMAQQAQQIVDVIEQVSGVSTDVKTASTVAVEAKSAADTAAQTATDAKADAATAKQAADAAAKTATTTAQHFWADDAGAHVTTAAADATTGPNTLIDSSGMVVRNGETALAKFSSDTIDLGMNSTSARIKMCGGLATIAADTTSNQTYIVNANGSYLTTDTMSPNGVGIVELAGQTTAVLRAPYYEIAGVNLTFARLASVLGGGTVLYDQAGAYVTSGTMSETCANFSFIDIEFTRDDRFSSVRLYNPDGKVAALFLAYSPTPSIHRIGIVNATFSGRSFSLADAYYADNGGPWSAIDLIFRITKIIGYR